VPFGCVGVVSGSISARWAVTTLEEMFNPERLRRSLCRAGSRADERRAVPGHEFGLRLAVADRDA